MTSKLHYIAAGKEVSTAEHILSSLKYLHGNCPSGELQSVLKMSLDLCYSTIRVDRGEPPNLPPSENLIICKDFITSLEYLKSEAARSDLDEVEMILEATFKICFVMYYLQIRGSYSDADLPSIV